MRDRGEGWGTGWGTWKDRDGNEGLARETKAGGEIKRRRRPRQDEAGRSSPGSSMKTWSGTGPQSWRGFLSPPPPRAQRPLLLIKTSV